jgi:GMP synthase-like glutamine amidotransferase
MRAHLFQHVPFEGLGSIDPWLRSVRAEITSTKLFERPVFPEIGEVDLLVVMGGPMSVNDEADLTWLVPEKRFIRQAIEADKAVLGVCLGAQLIAGAMGARVYPNREREIGWFSITSVRTVAGGALFAFPPEAPAFHWHGETFDLPAGAVHLARSAACENQAFQIGRRVIGLQFHLETTPESARALATNCGSELVPSRYVQSEEQILAAPASTYEMIHELMGRVLTFLSDRRP